MIHVMEFGFEDSFAAGREAVVASAGITVSGGGSADFVDEGEVEETLESGVERAGAHANLARRKFVGFLHDGVAVLGAIGEGKKDEEDGWGEREKALEVVGE